MPLILITGLLLVIWLVLLLMGKGGFIHILLLNALGVASVEVMTRVRARMQVRPNQTISETPASDKLA